MSVRRFHSCNLRKKNEISFHSESSARIDYVPALCTHRPSHLKWRKVPREQQLDMVSRSYKVHITKSDEQ